MTNIILCLLSLYQVAAFAVSELTDSPVLGLTSEEASFGIPVTNLRPLEPLDGDDEEGVIAFEEPINPEYLRDAISMLFRNQRPSGEHDAMKRSSFMRFGRSDSSFMRFGKRQLETYAGGEPGNRSGERSERSNSRESRGDNFMRFGRSSFMRFGRSPGSFMRFGRSPSDFMRFGRQPSNFMRFGRNDPASFMRFGKANNFMRMGRPDNFMRFGRSDKNNFMRFGRSMPSSEADKGVHEPAAAANRTVENKDSDLNELMDYGY